MPNIGPMELIVVLVIVLLVFGPKRLPGLGKQLGSGMREFKDSISGTSKDDDEDDAFGRRTLNASTTADPTPSGSVAAPEPVEQPAPKPGA